MLFEGYLLAKGNIQLKYNRKNKSLFVDKSTNASYTILHSKKRRMEFEIMINRKTKIKIVADSSADLLEMQGIEFESVPLKITTQEREYVDDCNVDIAEMAEYLLHYKGKSSSSCPNPNEWMEAFGDANCVFCIAITSKLSGSYNSACIAKNTYEKTYAGRRVFVIDSLSAGPELKLLAEKLRELICKGKDCEEIAAEIAKYQQKTGLLFALESLNNFARNGRVSPVLAKAIGMLGIRLVGRASAEGTLEPLSKSRGEKRALATLIEHLEKEGYGGGKLRIGHCLNEEAAQVLAALVREKWSCSDVEIYQLRALCSFYAEKGGMLVGFEKN